MRDAVRPLARLLSARGPWLRAVGLVVLVNAVFLLLALWVALLPREPLVERIQDAFASASSSRPTGWGWRAGAGTTSTLIVPSSR